MRCARADTARAAACRDRRQGRGSGGLPRMENRTAANAAIHRSHITAPRKAWRQIGCALPYAILGGGTGGRSARGDPSAGSDGKMNGCDGDSIAMTRSSHTRSSFTFTGAFCSCCSCCLPSVIRLHISHGCSPSSVVFTADAKESAFVRSMIIRVHATDCSSAQCPPTLASNARITRMRLNFRRAAATGARASGRRNARQAQASLRRCGRGGLRCGGLASALRI